MAAACRKSFQVRKVGGKTIEHKSAAWWTMELTMRKKINALRRRFQHTVRDENPREHRQLYQQQKYVAALRESKILSWKEYCNATTTPNPWNAVYKLVPGNLKKSSTLPLSLTNKILIYKMVLKPIWTYAIWGCTAASNLAVIQRYQAKTLRQITNAPRYVTNHTLHTDLRIPPVRTVFQQLA
jgi:hypothetical protein